MKKIIILLLILFHILTFNNISLAEYDNHTLQVYNSTLAYASDDIHTTELKGKKQTKDYLRQEDNIMSPNTVFKATKALGLACLSFVLFVIVILLINKFIFKKQISTEYEEYDEDDEPEDSDEKNNPSSFKSSNSAISSSNHQQSNTEMEKTIYDFYKRNID